MKHLQNESRLLEKKNNNDPYRKMFEKVKKRVNARALRKTKGDVFPDWVDEAKIILDNGIAENKTPEEIDALLEQEAENQGL